MREPIHGLKGIQQKAIDKTYKFQRLYRNLYNPEFYLLAYQNIAKSQGSMTAGADGITLDGMSMARIEAIIASIKDRSYQPKPARRTYITKKNGKKRPTVLAQHFRRSLPRPSTAFPPRLRGSSKR